MSVGGTAPTWTPAGGFVAPYTDLVRRDTPALLSVRVFILAMYLVIDLLYL